MPIHIFPSLVSKPKANFLAPHDLMKPYEAFYTFLHNAHKPIQRLHPQSFTIETIGIVPNITQLE